MLTSHIAVADPDHFVGGAIPIKVNPILGRGERCNLDKLHMFTFIK